MLYDNDDHYIELMMKSLHGCFVLCFLFAAALGAQTHTGTTLKDGEHSIRDCSKTRSTSHKTKNRVDYGDGLTYRKFTASLHIYNERPVRAASGLVQKLSIAPIQMQSTQLPNPVKTPLPITRRLFISTGNKASLAVPSGRGEPTSSPQASQTKSLKGAIASSINAQRSGTTYQSVSPPLRATGSRLKNEDSDARPSVGSPVSVSVGSLQPSRGGARSSPQSKLGMPIAVSRPPAPSMYSSLIRSLASSRRLPMKVPPGPTSLTALK